MNYEVTSVGPNMETFNETECFDNQFDSNVSKALAELKSYVALNVNPEKQK